MVTKSSEKPAGGVKGFFLRAGKSFYSGGLVARDVSWWLAKQGGQWGLLIASTSMVVLLPLIFEINRETQMLSNERLQVKELRNQGHSDRQLTELGFMEASLHSPSVASLNKA